MYKKILVPLDGSELSECVLDHVKELATGSPETEVVLLTVIEEVSSISTWGVPQAEAFAPSVQATRRQKIMQPALEYLTRQSEKLKQKGIAVKTEIVEEGGGQKVADLILLYAQDNDIDLIIMSSHGRSGISRWAFGSVADKVVSRSLIPVLSVVPTGCRLP